MKSVRLFVLSLIGVVGFSWLGATNIRNIKGLLACFDALPQKYQELSPLIGVAIHESGLMHNLYNYAHGLERDEPEDHALLAQWVLSIPSPVVRLVRGFFSYSGVVRTPKNLRVSALIVNKFKTHEDFAEKIGHIVARLWWIKHKTDKEGIRIKNEVLLNKKRLSKFNFGARVGPSYLVNNSDLVKETFDPLCKDCMLDGFRIVYLAGLWQVCGTDRKALAKYIATIKNDLIELGDKVATTIQDLMGGGFEQAELVAIKSDVRGYNNESSLDSLSLEKLTYTAFDVGSIPPSVGQEYAVPFEYKDHSYFFPDCTEHAFRLFINQVAYDYVNKSFDPSRFSALTGVEPDERLKNFYIKNNDVNGIGNKDVYKDWVSIVSNIPLISYNQVTDKTLHSNGHRGLGFIRIPQEYARLKPYYEDKGYTVIEDDNVGLYELIPSLYNVIMFLNTFFNIRKFSPDDILQAFEHKTFIKDNFFQIMYPFGSVSSSFQGDIEDQDISGNVVSFDINLDKFVEKFPQETRDPYSVTMRFFIGRHGELVVPESQAVSIPYLQNMTMQSLSQDLGVLALLLPYEKKLALCNDIFASTLSGGNNTFLRTLLLFFSMPLHDHNYVADIINKIIVRKSPWEYVHALKVATMIENHEDQLKKERLSQWYVQAIAHPHIPLKIQDEAMDLALKERNYALLKKYYNFLLNAPEVYDDQKITPNDQEALMAVFSDTDFDDDNILVNKLSALIARVQNIENIFDVNILKKIASQRVNLDDVFDFLERMFSLHFEFDEYSSEIYVFDDLVRNAITLAEKGEGIVARNLFLIIINNNLIHPGCDNYFLKHYVALAHVLVKTNEFVDDIAKKIQFSMALFNQQDKGIELLGLLLRNGHAIDEIIKECIMSFRNYHTSHLLWKMFIDVIVEQNSTFIKQQIMNVIDIFLAQDDGYLQKSTVSFLEILWENKCDVAMMYTILMALLIHHDENIKNMGFEFYKNYFIQYAAWDNVIINAIKEYLLAKKISIPLVLLMIEELLKRGRGFEEVQNIIDDKKFTLIVRARLSKLLAQYRE